MIEKPISGAETGNAISTMSEIGTATYPSGVPAMMAPHASSVGHDRPVAILMSPAPGVVGIDTRR